VRAIRTDGVGLAAPQVGVNLRLMVYNAEGRPDAGEEVVLCNPVLEEVSQKEDFFEEGCLSFPEIYADVKVRYQSLLPWRSRTRGHPVMTPQHKYTLNRAAGPRATAACGDTHA
jgi:hypothetical protein